MTVSPGYSNEREDGFADTSAAKRPGERDKKTRNPFELSPGKSVALDFFSHSSLFSSSFPNRSRILVSA
jgi:hypothetical protein